MGEGFLRTESPDFALREKFARHHPGGKPFSCDIVQAVPAAYKGEAVPLFPYITSKYRFIGLAYEWKYHWLLALFKGEVEHYAYHSEVMRAEFTRRKRRFSLRQRNGADYLVGPASDCTETSSKAIGRQASLID